MNKPHEKKKKKKSYSKVIYVKSLYVSPDLLVQKENECPLQPFGRRDLFVYFLLVLYLLDHHVVCLICSVLSGLALQANVNQKPLELWILMIHKVILQTQQGNIRFANCLTDIPAIILKYCCSRTHFIIFQLDCILKLYLSQDKYIASICIFLFC